MTSEQIDIGILRKIPVFDSLSDTELRRILQAPENRIEEHGMKETIIKEAEIGDCMYVILDGEVEVSIRGMGGSGRDLPITRLRAGDFFGEQALTSLDRTGRRNATVKTVFGATLFRIDKKYVQLGVKSDVDESGATEDVTDSRTMPPIKRKQKNTEIRNLVQNMRLFQSLKESELASINIWTEVETVGPGDFVLKEAEKGDSLFVVLEGQVEIFTLDEHGKIVILAVRGPGEYFGEQALLPGSSGQRNAYARSQNNAKVLKVPKAYFRLILKRDSELAQKLQKIGQAQKSQRAKLHKH